MDIATMIAKGVTAEALVEALAEQLDRDWQELMDKAQDVTDLMAATRALDKASAIAPYRAMLNALRDVWQADRDVQVSTTVPIRPA